MVGAHHILRVVRLDGWMDGGWDRARIQEGSRECLSISVSSEPHNREMHIRGKSLTLAGLLLQKEGNIYIL